MYIYIYIHIYMCICVYIYIYMYIHTCIYTQSKSLPAAQATGHAPAGRQGAAGPVRLFISIIIISSSSSIIIISYVY